MFERLLKPRIFKTIKEDDTDVRISCSSRCSGYRVEYDPEGEFLDSEFSYDEAKCMARQQYFNPGTILIDIKTGKKFIVSGESTSKQSNNGKFVKDAQKITPY
jgi:hypothetical protein